MGVTGLWRLIEPAGKPVPVETLENKVLAVDISIWLHQVVKGYQDAKGAPLPNAHLIGLFQRLCKLLYFRIKPVFVFDGAFPDLKKETIAKRQDNKQKYNSESERLKRELAILLTKKTAIGSLLGKQISPKKNSNTTNRNDDELFKLPALPEKECSESDSDDEGTSSSNSSLVDLHSIDLESQKFKNLPTKEKYDLLVELKETRKMNSWGKLHELPKKSDNFSDFQLQRLLKRRKVQECLEETEKEMGDTGMSLNELESLLNEEGIDTKIETLPTRRIASNNSTRYLLINDVKQALENAKKKKEAENQASTSTNIEDKKDELEEDLEKAIKMSLGCVDESDISIAKTDDSWTSYMSDSEYSTTDSEEDDGCELPNMTSAKAYIMQYCDFTERVVDKIVSKKTKATKSKNKPKVNEIIEEMNKENPVTVDNIELSSSEDECHNESVVEVDTTADSKILDDNDDVDATQASVIVLENPTQTVITLDSTLEDSAENLSPKKIDADEKDDLVSVSSDDISPNTFTQVKVASSQKPNEQNDEQSDSSDNDFEDVPEIEDKPVVQLTLNINEALEDDIFADVFMEKPTIETMQNQGENLATKSETDKTESIIVSGDQDDDDELQKAIMMSLECVAEEDIPVVSKHKEIVANDKPAKDKEQNLDSRKDQSKTSKNIESLNKILSKPSKNIEGSNKTLSESSKNVESLNEILSAQTSKQFDKDIAHDKYISQTIKDKPSALISKEQLNVMVEEIQTEEQDLLQEKGRLDRVGRNITEQMTKEAQELLQIFGIPYIVAPMEAEAQCAFLESVNLTDGTITDDSDIWLFGGRTVYKNFFNQKKHVLQFLADRIEKSFNLSREQLVLLALLVGSDYTTGVAGVGPVTAMEILASFPFNKRQLNEATKQARYTQMITGLQEFKQWVRGGKKTDNTSLKKKLRNIDLHDDFPSVRVVQAYLEPNVEKSEDKFSWGEIDITILRDYTKAKFGWSQHKLDEIVKPVLKRIVERKSQKSLQDYFKKKIDFQSLEDQMSKRVKAAVLRMGPEKPTERIEEDNTNTKPAGKRKGKNSDGAKAGPSKSKKKKTDDSVLKDLSVKVVSEVKDGKSEIDIKINKTDRFQEIIPQREKDKQSLLQNKMKAIELFRKTNIDKKKKTTKRKPLLPKDRAELSESSDSN